MYLIAQAPSSFTVWQNDLHLILGFNHRLLACPCLDLATLIATATGAFSGAASIGSCEDRSGYVYHRVPHQPLLHPAYRHGLPMCFAGRAFLCRGANSLFIAGSTFYEPGVSGHGWVWTDAEHLELTGYEGEAIGADGDLVVTLVGQNSVVETHAPDADISMSGMEVWGNLTLRGSGSLTATGSQCGIHVAQALVVDGCTVDARADGAGVVDQTVAGIAAGSLPYVAEAA